MERAGTNASEGCIRLNSEGLLEPVRYVKIETPEWIKMKGGKDGI